MTLPSGGAALYVYVWFVPLQSPPLHPSAASQPNINRRGSRPASRLCLTSCGALKIETPETRKINGGVRDLLCKGLNAASFWFFLCSPKVKPRCLDTVPGHADLARTQGWGGREGEGSLRIFSTEFFGPVFQQVQPVLDATVRHCSVRTLTVYYKPDRPMFQRARPGTDVLGLRTGGGRKMGLIIIISFQPRSHSSLVSPPSFLEASFIRWTRRRGWREGCVCYPRPPVVLGRHVK